MKLALAFLYLFGIVVGTVRAEDGLEAKKKQVAAIIKKVEQATRQAKYAQAVALLAQKEAGLESIKKAKVPPQWPKKGEFADKRYAVVNGQHLVKTIHARKEWLEAEKVEIANLKGQIESLRRGDAVVVEYPRLSAPFGVGDFGKCGAGFVITQVVDENNAIVEYDDVAMYLHGIKTAGLVDNQRVVFDYAWIDGTKSYTNVLGANRTIMSVVPIKQSFIDRECKPEPLPGN